MIVRCICCFSYACGLNFETAKIVGIMCYLKREVKLTLIIHITRFFAIGLLQLAITWYKIGHAGGQAHYYSRNGTLKQRDLNQ